MSPASVGVLLRSIVVLEQEGADTFFGEPEFDVADLLRTTPDGAGIISRSSSCATSWTSRACSARSCSGCWPSCTRRCPRSGDLPKPKLCFFFDEAHLLFDDASDALLEQIERTARLIRSKGVGVYFVTQAPTDVPSSVLAQLGNRVQHALRAFTPDDADALRKTARTFPMTDFYDVEQTITSLGTGEALVTVLSPRGVPTPLAATRLLPPDSLMAALPDAASGRGSRRARCGRSTARPSIRESAHEMITARAARPRRAAAARDAMRGRCRRRPRRAQHDDAGPAASARSQRQAREMRGPRRPPSGAPAERPASRRGPSAAASGWSDRRPDRWRVITSQAGQDVLRGVFGTLFGGGKSR